MKVRPESCLAPSGAGGAPAALRLTDEQARIARDMVEGCVVVPVQAFAGSGKTLTMRERCRAESLRGRRVLVMYSTVETIAPIRHVGTGDEKTGGTKKNQFLLF